MRKSSELKVFDIWGHPHWYRLHRTTMWLGNIEAYNHQQAIERARGNKLFRGFTITRARIRRTIF